MAHWLAFEFLDNGQPVFVGVGRRGNGLQFRGMQFWPLYEFFDCNICCPWEFVERVSGEHPAEIRFRSCNSKIRSEVYDWLASLNTMPEYRTIGEGEFNPVKLIARRRVAELQRHGVKLLSGKLTKKIIKDAKKVWHEGQEYKSVRAAAQATGYPKSTVSRWCNSPTNDDWKFVP